MYCCHEMHVSTLERNNLFRSVNNIGRNYGVCLVYGAVLFINLLIFELLLFYSLKNLEKMKALKNA